MQTQSKGLQPPVVPRMYLTCKASHRLASLRRGVSAGQGSRIAQAAAACIQVPNPVPHAAMRTHRHHHGTDTLLLRAAGSWAQAVSSRRNSSLRAPLAPARVSSMHAITPRRKGTKQPRPETAAHDQAKWMEAPLRQLSATAMQFIGTKSCMPCQQCDAHECIQFPTCCTGTRKTTQLCASLQANILFMSS